jgi:hypothetical protein
MAAPKGYVVRTAARDEVIPLHSIYEYDAVTIASQLPKHQIGDKCRMSDGRVYHYARNGTAAALVAANLLQNAVTVADHWNMVATVISAIGDTKIFLLPTTAVITKDYYANGYLWVNEGAGLGMCYKIKKNDYCALVTGGYAYLYDPLVVATAAASNITVVANPWQGVIQCPAVPTGIPVGVAPIAVPQSTATIHYYFWAQTWGPCCISNANAAQVIGTPRMTQGTTAGGVIVAAAHGIPEIGWLLNGLQVTAVEAVGCFLRISQ